MNIQEFTKEIINEYSGFFVLQHVGKNTDEITIFLKKITEDKVYDKDIAAFRLPDNNILVCFKSNLSMFPLNNLVASDGTTEEIINLQLFERVKRYYNKSIEESFGGFLFHDSIPVWNEWRCHYDKYGPETFMKNDAEVVPLINNLEDLYVYEPILSVNSVAHLIYIHANVDENYYLNEDPFPRTSKTLQENLKQITEWADVTEDPWSNEEKIATRAVDFMNALRFSNELKEEIKNTQPPMQIFKYLSGDSEARTGATNPGELTSLIEIEILKRLSHFSLSNLLQIFDVNISQLDKEYILQVERTRLEENQNRMIGYSDLDISSFDSSNVDLLKDNLKEKNPEIFSMTSVLLEVFSSYKEVLDSITI